MTPTISAELLFVPPSIPDDATRLARLIVRAELADDYWFADACRRDLRAANRTRRLQRLRPVRATQAAYFGGSL